MDKRDGKPININDVKKELQLEREQKWNTLFDKYEGMDEVEDETEDEEWAECDEEYSEESEKMHVEDEEEEEEDGSEIIDSEDGQDGEGGEAGKDEGSDENMFTSKDFIAAFKEVAQKRTQILQQIYVEHRYIKEIKNKDTTQRFEKCMKQQGVAISTGTPASRNAMLANSMQFALPNISNIDNTTSLHENNLALIKRNEDLALVPYVDDISSDESDVQMFQEMEGDAKYLTKVIMTTTTTTTKTTVVKKTILNEAERNDTPKKGSSVNAPKSLKKKRQFDGSYKNEHFHSVDNDFETLSTPKSERRKTNANPRFNTPTGRPKHSLLAITNTPNLEVVVSTPKTPKGSNSAMKQDSAKVIVKKNQIKKQLCDSLSGEQLSRKDRQKVTRDVEVNANETLSVVLVRENDAISSPDPLYALKNRKSTLFRKDRDDH